MKKVLVVDDELGVLASVKGLLEDEFEVLTATDPRAALHLLEQEEVAVILSDQRMPGISGDQFFNQAKDISMATRVLITGYANLEEVVRAVNCGQIYAYLEKPWDATELRTTVLMAADDYELRRTLRESERRLRSLVDHLPDGVCLLDAKRRVMLANPTARECLRVLAGVEVGEMISHIGMHRVEDILTPRAGGIEVNVEGPPRRIFEVEARPISEETSEGWWVLVVWEVTEERMRQQDHLATVGHPDREMK